MKKIDLLRKIIKEEIQKLTESSPIDFQFYVEVGNRDAQKASEAFKDELRHSNIERVASNGYGASDEDEFVTLLDVFVRNGVTEYYELKYNGRDLSANIQSIKKLI